VTIWTIGHSTRTIADFLALLAEHRVQILADVRRIPASRRMPHFSAPALERALADSGLGYLAAPDLGGRRPPLAESPHHGWREAAFRGYADYMDQGLFRAGVERLTGVAEQSRTAVMCAEASWRRCHRGLLADYLKAAGWTVLHIVDAGDAEAHPWTAPARIVDGRLSYPAPGLFP
jgi:uncharacterized protein (DUF488 family)